MDVNSKLGRPAHAISDEKIQQFADQVVETLRQGIVTLLTWFAADQPTPARMLDLENRLQDLLREIGLMVLQWLVSQVEPEVEELPKTVTYQNQTYRRLADKSRRADVVTRFGKVVLHRARYRRGRSGRVIFPLEIALGIMHGFTPAAATRVGKQFAATGSSQGRTLELIEDQMGVKIGPEKLRKIMKSLANDMEPFRQSAQVDKVIELMKLARMRKLKPVLSISRDGVALGLAPQSNFEMAAVACVSVMAGGKKLGTVYLGRVPETNQATLSDQLTSLLTAIVRRCGDCVPEIVYVTDAGKIETAYWKNTLSKFFVDGVRTKVTRVVDYYHASERLTTIANALKFGKKTHKRKGWLKHVRRLLLQPGGHGRVLRSIAKMRELYGYKVSKKTEVEEAKKAERYLRRYRRFMDYATMKFQGYPIGSGVVESACKQIVSERMKLSGMRWHKEGGQVTMGLRCLLLSGIWDTVYRTSLSSKPTVSHLIDFEPPKITAA